MTRRNVVELEQLRDRLREAEETLAAIRNGEVDSLIVSGPNGDQVFSLKGAEQPYRIFVEQMLEGAVTLTPEGTILYCNRRFADMVRTRLEKVIGAAVQTFIRGNDQHELEQILSDPAGRKARYLVAAADGALIPAQLSFSRMPMDEEGVEAICLVVTDLTEQEEKRELTAALDNLRSAQEQLQRQNEELIGARAAAEAANAAKDRFLAALSHELRTPLTPVLMTVASMEANTAVPDAIRPDLALLRRNVELEARLIDDLLDITRIVQGKVELRPEVVDVHPILLSALEISRSEITGKRLHLTQALTARKSHISGDAVRIQQIIWNLVRNAVKFTPEHGQVTVGSRNQDGCLLIWVTDSGIGIDAEAIGRIFTPFEQADRSITRQFGGLGLGLTISKRLAELHGGSLTAESGGRQCGATFTLTLPTVPSPGEMDAGSGASQPRESRSLRILLVEDHDDTRRSMARLLSRRHRVRDTGSVAEALRCAAEERFDLVISDVGLPDGNGLDLMRHLRAGYGLRGICLSGFGMEEDVSRSIDAGFLHHLTKPIDLRRLEAVIETVTQ